MVQYWNDSFLSLFNYDMELCTVLFAGPSLFLSYIVSRTSRNILVLTMFWGGIFKLLRSPGIDSKESIPPRICSLSPYFSTLMEHRNRVQGINSASLCSLAGRYDNTIPTRFLAPIDCLKIPALAGRYDNTILTRFLVPIDCSKIPAQISCTIILYKCMYIRRTKANHLNLHGFASDIPKWWSRICPVFISDLALI